MARASYLNIWLFFHKIESMMTVNEIRHPSTSSQPSQSYGGQAGSSNNIFIWM